MLVLKNKVQGCSSYFSLKRIVIRGLITRDSNTRVRSFGRLEKHVLFKARALRQLLKSARFEKFELLKSAMQTLMKTAKSTR
jgi:hypothetical protein